MDFKKMMMQARKMQMKMQERISAIEQKEFISEKNGVKIVVMGNFKILSIEIDDKLMDDKEILQDVLTSALNEILIKINKEKEDVYNEAQQVAQGSTGLF